MKAIHSTWTKPRVYGAGAFFIEDFDILTTILSALKWREKNGEIKMVTDARGYEFYKSRGMSGVWDEVTTELDNIPDSIAPEMFWAAGKLYALGTETAPVAALDTDFIVWDKLAFGNLGDLTVIHREAITPEVYPDIHRFNMRPGYVFNPELDWSEEPANAAFYVIKNDCLKERYISEALNFMENSVPDDSLTYMVFAEQRLMAMTAKMEGVNIGSFSTPDRLFADGERYFTHIWGMKQQMRDMPGLRADFCRRCIERIKNDFPDYYTILHGIKELEKYFV